MSAPSSTESANWSSNELKRCMQGLENKICCYRFIRWTFIYFYNVPNLCENGKIFEILLFAVFLMEKMSTDWYSI